MIINNINIMYQYVNFLNYYIKFYYHNKTCINQIINLMLDKFHIIHL